MFWEKRETIEREGERREEEEEDGGAKIKQPRYGTIWFCMELRIFGMETTLSMDFVWITWNFKALYG